MMPDLGHYAGTVLSAYAAAIALLVGLVGLTLWQGARMKKRLAQIEARQRGAVE